MPHTKEIDLDFKSTKVCPKTCTGGGGSLSTHIMYNSNQRYTPQSLSECFKTFKSEVHWNLEVFVTLEARVVFVGITKAFTNKLSQSNLKDKFFSLKVQIS